MYFFGKIELLHNYAWGMQKIECWDMPRESLATVPIAMGVLTIFAVSGWDRTRDLVHSRQLTYPLCYASPPTPEVFLLHIPSMVRGRKDTGTSRRDGLFSTSIWIDMAFGTCPLGLGHVHLACPCYLVQGLKIQSSAYSFFDRWGRGWNCIGTMASGLSRDNETT